MSMLDFEILTILGLPEALIKSTMDMLDERATELHSGNPRNVGGGVFGGSGNGQDLEFNTNLAHQHVADAVREMVAGLRGYADNLDGFAKDLQNRDEQAGVDLTPTRKHDLDHSGDCTNSPDYTNNHPTSCQAPTGGDD